MAADIDGLGKGDWRHNLTAVQMIIEIEEGSQVVPLAFKEWVSAHEAHLNFGPRCTAAKQDKCTKLLYALQEVL